MRSRSLNGPSFCLSVLLTLAALQDPQTTSRKTWIGKHSEYEELLETAEIIEVEDVGVGVTKPRKATLKKEDEVFHAAYKPIKRGRHSGYWESYQAEIAAYELDKLIGLDMVPPTVERRIGADQGSLQYWVEDCHLYADVQEKTPQTRRWSHELSRMKMFDILINNEDRNARNFLVDPVFNIILIDHSRAFITGDRMLRNEGKLPSQFDRKLVEKVKALTRETLDTHLGDLMMGGQVKDILKRRDKLLEHLDKLIQEQGEARVLF